MDQGDIYAKIFLFSHSICWYWFCCEILQIWKKSWEYFLGNPSTKWQPLYRYNGCPHIRKPKWLLSLKSPNEMLPPQLPVHKWYLYWFPGPIKAFQPIRIHHMLQPWTWHGITAHGGSLSITSHRQTHTDNTSYTLCDQKKHKKFFLLLCAFCCVVQFYLLIVLQTKETENRLFLVFVYPFELSLFFMDCKHPRYYSCTSVHECQPISFHNVVWM